MRFNLPFDKKESVLNKIQNFIEVDDLEYDKNACVNFLF